MPSLLEWGNHRQPHEFITGVMQLFELALHTIFNGLNFRNYFITF
jgi:hypothetical protein